MTRHITIKRFLPIIVLTSLIGLIDSPTLAQSGNQIITRTGNTEPNGNGTFSTFTAPLLNNAGQIAFGSTLNNTTGGGNDDVGIYRADGTTIDQIAREFFIPLGGATLTDLSDPHGINNAGQIVYTGTVDSLLISPASQVRVGSPGTTTIIAAEGGPASNGRGGTNGTFTGFHGIFPAINDTGQVAFLNVLNGTTGGASDNVALFRGSGGPITQLMREGQAAPDNDGALSVFLISQPPSFNNTGQFAITDAVTGTTNDEGIFRGSGGAIEQVARVNQTVPNGDGSFRFISGQPAFNDAGQASFIATLKDTAGGIADSSGVFREENGTTIQIARDNQTAPDSNGRFASFSNQTMNEAGQVAFQANLDDTAGGPGTGSDDSGIFRGTGGSVTQIVREGQSVPNVGASFSQFFRPALNNLGQTAFTAFVTGAEVTFANDHGLFIADGIDTVQIAREGQALGNRTVTSLALQTSTAEKGSTRSGINDAGQVAYSAILDNNDQAILLWTPPESHWTTGSGSWSTTSNWQQGITPKSLYDVFLDPVSGATITGMFGNEHVKSLSVGTTSGAQVVLNQGSGDLTSINGIVINARGKIHLSNKHVLNSPTLTNSGIVSGDGQINATFENTSSGEVRVSGGEHLIFTGSNKRNEGRIDVNGQDGLATLEFDEPLTNEVDTGVIISRGSTVLRFDGGLINEGGIGIAFSDTTFFGDIINDGEIFVSGDSDALFVDDVTNNIIMHVESGSTAVFFGDYSGLGVSGGGLVTMHGDLAPGSSPGISHFETSVIFGPSSNTDIEIEGPSATGPTQFDQIIGDQFIALDGDLNIFLDENYIPEFGDVFAIVTASTRYGEYDQINGMLPAGGDFAFAPVYDYQGNVGLSLITALTGDVDLDGSVDHADLDIFFANVGSSGDWSSGNLDGDGDIDLHDLELILRNLGRTIPFAIAQSLPSSVPEPTTLVLLSLGLLAGLRRRVA